MLIWWNWQWTQEMESDPITSWQIEEEKVEAVTDFIFLGSKITVDGASSHEIKRLLQLGWKAMTNLVQFPVAQLCPTLCDPMDCSTSGLPVHHQLLELAQTNVLWVGDAIEPSHPLLSPPPPAINLFKHQGLFHWVSSLHQWPKYCSFSFSISSSNEHSGLVSFRMEWLDLLAVQGTLKSLLQHHSSKAWILHLSL